MNDTRNDIPDAGEVQRKPFSYYESIVQSRNHVFYLSEAVGEPSDYIEMIHIIKTAGPTDTVYINLNIPGGRVDTGVQIINAMRSSQAKIVTSLESEAHSLGTLLFLSGDEYIVHDDCLMMFHNYSGGTYGKGNEQIAQLDATVKWFTKLAKGICVPFLSEEEFDRMCRGEDLWLDSDEIKNRLQKLVDMNAANTATVSPPLEQPKTRRTVKKKVKLKKKSKTKKKPLP